MYAWVRARPDRKWHKFRTFTRLSGGIATQCGRRVNQNTEGYAGSNVAPDINEQCRQCTR